MFGMKEMWRIHVHWWYFGSHPKFQQSEITDTSDSSLEKS